MSVLRAARAARVGQSSPGYELRHEIGQGPCQDVCPAIRRDLRRDPGRDLRQRFAAAIIIVPIFVLAALTISCSTNSTTKTVAANHIAYITLPDEGSVLMLQINGTTGAITGETQTPQVQGTSPTGLALLPSGKFLYTANSRANT